VVQRRRLLAYTQTTMVRVHPGSMGFWILDFRFWIEAGCATRPCSHPIENPKSEIENPSCPRGAVWSARHPVTVEIRGSNPLGDADTRRGTQFGKAAKLKPSWCVGSTPTRVSETHASAGHWRAQVAVTHPPFGCGGSTPSRRTCEAFSSQLSAISKEVLLTADG
jgi:hypothetical protein